MEDQFIKKLSNTEAELKKSVAYKKTGSFLSLVHTSAGSSRPEVFWKKVFLELSQNSQENTCAGASFLIKLQA